MSLADQLKDAGESLFSMGLQLGYNSKVTFGEKEYEVNASPASASSPMETGGLEDRQSVTIMIPSYSAASVPVNARIGYMGKLWRLDQKTDYPNGITRWIISRGKL